MNRLPLICFYQDRYIFSYDYRQLSIQVSELDHFQQQHHDSMIIYRMNYEWNWPEQLFKAQEKLNQASEMSLFIVNTWEEWSVAKLEQWLAQFARLRPFKLSAAFTPIVSQKSYSEQLAAVLEGINSGDYYQLNLSLPFVSSTTCSPLETFAHYHGLMPGSYHAFIPSDEGCLICLSPELFLKKDHTTYQTSPIKGTAANNPDAIEALLTSLKENAELSMIVDLLRNDLNINADIRSSKVLAHRQLMHLGHLVHTYSTVEAESSKPLFSVLSSILPGGSISGCPKKKVVEELTRIEPFRRTYYSGIAGWIHGEQAESAIVIRSFWQDPQGTLTYHAGGGIVADSDLNQEYQEILLKARRINS